MKYNTVERHIEHSMHLLGAHAPNVFDAVGDWYYLQVGFMILLLPLLANTFSDRFILGEAVGSVCYLLLYVEFQL